MELLDNRALLVSKLVTVLKIKLDVMYHGYAIVLNNILPSFLTPVQMY